MRTTFRLLFIFGFCSFASLNGQQIQITDILQKLSIKNITATIQEVPGSSGSIMLTVKSQGNDTRFNFLRQEVLENAANIFGDNTKIFEEKLALPERRGLPNVTKKISEYQDEEIENIIDYMAKRQYPEICLLRECWCIKRYNDFDESKFIQNDRGNFERMLACRYLQHKNSSPNIVYTGFASGGLFTDLRILTLLLSSKKDLENHILFTQNIFEIKKSIAMGANCKTLVDKKLRLHEKSKSQRDLIQNVTIDGIHLIDPDYQGTINILQKNIGHDIKNIQIDKNETLGDALRIVQVIQLANFISSISGNAITIYLHDYAKAYVDSCSQNHDLKPTIVTSIDHEADNLLYFYGFKVSYTYVECMLMLRKVLTNNTWFGDLNWKTPAKIKPLLNVQILVKNPGETRQYLEEKNQAIHLQEMHIKEYEANHGARYLSL